MQSYLKALSRDQSSAEQFQTPSCAFSLNCLLQVCVNAKQELMTEAFQLGNSTELVFYFQYIIINNVLKNINNKCIYPCPVSTDT